MFGNYLVYQNFPELIPQGLPKIELNDTLYSMGTASYSKDNTYAIHTKKVTEYCNNNVFIQNLSENAILAGVHEAAHFIRFASSIGRSGGDANVAWNNAFRDFVENQVAHDKQLHEIKANRAEYIVARMFMPHLEAKISECREVLGNNLSERYVESFYGDPLPAAISA